MLTKNCVNQLVDPEKTVLVLYYQNREVGRIPATAANAATYIEEMGRYYKVLDIRCEYDEFAGLLAGLLS